MTISIDWQNRLVLSTASITDIVAFKDTIRDFEDDDVGMLYPPIITFKQLDLGGGAYFYGVDFINGYQLKFPNTGNYTVIGNIGATIVPVAGVFVDRTKSAAFATVAGSGGSSGPTAEEIAEAILAAAQITPIHSNVKLMNGATLIGTGQVGDDWRGSGVQPQ